MGTLDEKRQGTLDEGGVVNPDDVADLDTAGLATDVELNAHVNDAIDAHDASAISFVPNGSIAATDVQAAIQEVRDEATGAPATIDYLVGTADAGLSNEIVVGTTPGGELGGTWASPTVDTTHSGSAHHDPVTVGTGLDVTGQLIDLDLSEVASGGELGGFMDAPTVDATHSGSTHSAATDTHIGDTSDAHDASAISFVPTGNIVATDVQAAIAEAATDAQGSAGPDADVTVDAAGAAGTAGTTARSAHGHQLVTNSSAPGAIAISGAAGTSTTAPSRGDHTHAHETAHVEHDTIFDAKGDLVVGTGADTSAKLTVGADDTIPWASTAETTGIKWVGPGTPVSLGIALAEGTADTFSRSDHVHTLAPYISTISTPITATKSTANGVDEPEISILQLMIPANTFVAGNTIEFFFQGLISIVANQPIVDFRLRIGTSSTGTSNPQVAILNTFTTNNVTDAGILLRHSQTIKTIGATGTTRGQMAYFTELNTQFAGGMELSSTTADTVIDTTSILYIDFTNDWGPGGSGHAITFDNGYIRLV